MNRKSHLLFWICVLSTLAAIGAHTYLTNHHYDLKYGSMASEGICNINQTFNCKATTLSTYSEFMGIPIAIFGGLINLILLGLLLAARFPIVSGDTQRALSSPIKILSLLIFLTSLVMGSISIFLIDAICPVCSLTYLFSLITFLTAWKHFEGGIKFSGLELKVLPATAAIILAFGFFINHNMLKEYGGSEIKEIIQLQFNEWKNGEPRNLQPVSPVKMNASDNPTIKVVEFADFLCGHCAQAYPIIHDFVEAHSDVEFSFQAFPLNGACNPAIKQSAGASCLLARVAYCAGQQNEAWDMQEWIFTNQRDLYSPDVAQTKSLEKAKELGIDTESFTACIDSEETKTIIRDQAKAGIEAGVSGTPALYINNKKVPSGFSLPLLEKIYNFSK